MYNKHPLGNFGPRLVSIDRVEALFEHAKRVVCRSPVLTTTEQKILNCRECDIHGESLRPIELNPNLTYNTFVKSPVTSFYASGKT